MAKKERAFAIHAPPAVIWKTLMGEVEEGVRSGRAVIVHQEAPRRLVLEIRLGWGLAARYTYELSLAGAHTEVAGRVDAHGVRNRVARVITLGRSSTPYMLALTQGLANLKAAAEETAREA